MQRRRVGRDGHLLLRLSTRLGDDLFTSAEHGQAVAGRRAIVDRASREGRPIGDLRQLGGDEITHARDVVELELLLERHGPERVDDDVFGEQLFDELANVVPPRNATLRREELSQRLCQLGRAALTTARGLLEHVPDNADASVQPSASRLGGGKVPTACRVDKESRPTDASFSVSSSYAIAPRA